MRFTAYDICMVENNKTFIVDLKKDELLRALYKYPKIMENDEYFAPIHIHESGEYILGTLAQSYQAILTKFEPLSITKDEIQLDGKNINDKTYFYINCSENRIYVQGKRYPTNLNKKVTLERIEKILNDIVGVNIVLIPAKLKYSIDEIEEIFKTSYVKKISFRNLDGLKIPEGTVLHNPKKYLDEALIESYNTYSADQLSSMDLKAKEGEQLSKNPLARIGMVLSKINKREKIFKSMEIIDDGERTEIKPDGNEHKIVYVPKKDQDDSYETYDRIMKKVTRNYNGRFEE